MSSFTEFWVYFAAQPLWWIVITLAVYLLAGKLNRLAGGNALLHPVLISMAVLMSLLSLTETPYQNYFAGAQFIHFLLGPATVALAVPLFDHFARIKQMWLPITISCVIGAIIASASAILIAKYLGGSQQTLLSIAPKSITSPIALGVAEQLGGLPALAAALCLITGAIGTMLGPPLFRLLGIDDPAIKGFVLGLSSHGFGTAKAIEIDMQAGAFSGLAMGLTGLISAILIPIIVAVLV